MDSAMQTVKKPTILKRGAKKSRERNEHSNTYTKKEKGAKKSRKRTKKSNKKTQETQTRANNSTELTKQTKGKQVCPILRSEDLKTIEKGNETLATSSTRTKAVVHELFPYNKGVVSGPEAILQEHNNSSKNPKHEQFLPVTLFWPEHIQPGYQRKSICELVKTLADLTVKLTVTHVSNNRPETCNGKPYYHSKRRGQKGFVSFGKGRVVQVKKHSVTDCQPCPCSNCEKTSPLQEWAQIRVTSATHVVFDDAEAQQTVVLWGFDSDTSQGISFCGTSAQGNMESDVCNLFCATHDLDFADTLEDIFAKLKRLNQKVFNKYERTKEVESVDSQDGIYDDRYDNVYNDISDDDDMNDDDDDRYQVDDRHDDDTYNEEYSNYEDEKMYSDDYSYDDYDKYDDDDDDMYDDEDDDMYDDDMYDDDRYDVDNFKYDDEVDVSDYDSMYDYNYGYDDYERYDDNYNMYDDDYDRYEDHDKYDYDEDIPDAMDSYDDKRRYVGKKRYYDERYDDDEDMYDDDKIDYDDDYSDNDIEDDTCSSNDDTYDYLDYLFDLNNVSFDDLYDNDSDDQDYTFFCDKHMYRDCSCPRPYRSNWCL